MTMFPEKNPDLSEPSKNMVFGDKEKFRKALDKFIQDNMEGLIRLGRS